MGCLSTLWHTLSAHFGTYEYTSVYLTHRHISPSPFQPIPPTIPSSPPPFPPSSPRPSPPPSPPPSPLSFPAASDVRFRCVCVQVSRIIKGPFTKRLRRAITSKAPHKANRVASLVLGRSDARDSLDLEFATHEQREQYVPNERERQRETERNKCH